MAILARNLGLNRIQRADELLMSMALHAAADHLTFEHIERGEQRRRAVALVVMGHGSGAALLHRKTRLSASPKPGFGSSRRQIERWRGPAD